MPLFTSDELSEYLNTVDDQPAPDGYQGLALEIAKTFQDCEYLARVERAWMAIYLIDGPRGLATSCWGTGFAMGVEFARRRNDLQMLDQMNKG